MPHLEGSIIRVEAPASSKTGLWALYGGRLSKESQAPASSKSGLWAWAACNESMKVIGFEGFEGSAILFNLIVIVLVQCDLNLEARAC